MSLAIGAWNARRAQPRWGVVTMSGQGVGRGAAKPNAGFTPSCSPTRPRLKSEISSFLRWRASGEIAEAAGLGRYARHQAGVAPSGAPGDERDRGRQAGDGRAAQVSLGKWRLPRQIC